MFNLSNSRRSLLKLFILTVFAYSANAQQTSQTPTPTNNSSQQNINRQMEQQRQQQEEQLRMMRQRQQSELNNVRQKIMVNSINSDSVKFRKDLEVLYRKTSKKELKMLAVSENETKKYEVFLDNNKAGLIKLVRDLNCSDNQNVIVVTTDCLKYSMPGNGSSYSFRVKDYRIQRLADLAFIDNSFEVTGKLIHGVLVGIGNVPLENVNLQTAGVKYLAKLQPVVNIEDAAKSSEKFTEGVTQDGFTYWRAVKAVDNMTYVLRSIAYEGEVYRAVNGVTYNELDFDKRRDVIIAFRIVSRDSDKSVTILWKELENKDAPKIKRQDKDTQKIKENNFIAKERKLL